MTNLESIPVIETEQDLIELIHERRLAMVQGFAIESTIETMAEALGVGQWLA